MIWLVIKCTYAIKYMLFCLFKNLLFVFSKVAIGKIIFI